MPDIYASQRGLSALPNTGDPAGGASATEYGGQGVQRTVLTLENAIVAVVDSGGAAGGQGNLKVYDFPEGGIVILGASYNLAVVAGAGITATAALVGAVGSVAAGAGDSTLTTTEADIIPSTVGTLTGSAGVLKKLSAVVAAPFDGTTTPLDAFLNIAVPDAGITANANVIVNGTITILWTQIGDF